MNNVMKISVFLLCLTFLPACNAVLGPPGSEPEAPISANGQYSQYEMFIDGRPDSGLISSRGGFYIWREGNTWHIRTGTMTGPPSPYPDAPVYSGSVYVKDGIIAELNRLRTTMPRDVHTGPNDIVFRFEYDTGIQGFDFKVQRTGFEHCITFDLRINGALMPEFVNLGSSLHQPETLPLHICPLE